MRKSHGFCSILPIIILLTGNFLFADEIRFLRVGMLQNWFSSGGCEIEVGRRHMVEDQQDGFQYLAFYKNQDMQAAKELWIGTINFSDPLRDGHTYDYKVVRQIVTANSSQLHQFKDKSNLILGGIITAMRKKTTKNGNMMAYFVLEDLEGTIDVIVFPKTYEDFKEAMTEENVVVLEGRLDAAEFNVKILAESVIPIDNYKIKKSKKRKNNNASYHYLHIEADINQLDVEKLKGLKKIFKKHPGQNKVIIHFKAEQKIYHQQVNESIGVEYNKEIIREIENFLVHGKAWFEKTT